MTNPFPQKLPDRCAGCAAEDPLPTMTAGVSYPLGPDTTVTMWTLQVYCDDCAAALTVAEVAGHARDWGRYSRRLRASYAVLNPRRDLAVLTVERFVRA